MDALTSLVPAEVLALHAVIVTAVTTEDQGVSTITELATASTAFYALVALAIAFYIAGKASAKTWDRWDFLRMLIPGGAFVAWAMLQKTTVFDAVYPDLGPAPRTVTALFGAVVLGLAANVLAYKADDKPAPEDPKGELI